MRLELDANERILMESYTYSVDEQGALVEGITFLTTQRIIQHTPVGNPALGAVLHWFQKPNVTMDLRLDALAAIARGAPIGTRRPMLLTTADGDAYRLVLAFDRWRERIAAALATDHNRTLVQTRDDLWSVQPSSHRTPP